MPLVQFWDPIGLTAEQKVKLRKAVADAYKEVRPMLKDHEDLIWVIFHEIPSENWMIGPLNVKELRQKLGGR